MVVKTLSRSDRPIKGSVPSDIFIVAILRRRDHSVTILSGRESFLRLRKRAVEAFQSEKSEKKKKPRSKKSQDQTKVITMVR